MRWNGATVEVWEWINNFILHFKMDVITYALRRLGIIIYIYIDLMPIVLVHIDLTIYVSHHTKHTHTTTPQHRKCWINKVWWQCLVPTSTTRFASDVGYRMAKFNIVIQGKHFLWTMTSNSLTENEEHDIPSQILKTIFGLHASVIF